MTAATMPMGGSVAAPRQGLGFIISASSVGTLIEWYDFYLYGILAAFFGQHFLPPEVKFADSFLYSLGVFWLGFVVRPFGAIIFGYLGDRIGRKYTFMMTLILMGAATFLVGCLPTFATIGWLAPVILVALRLVQGLALGGEYGGAATYIAEHAPDGKRGFYTSWIQTTATLGIVAALLCIIAFRVGLGDADFTAYGWRFPFLISGVLVILSIYLRLRLAESPLFAKLKEQGKTSQNPTADSFGNGRNWGLILTALFGATAPEGVVWYTGQFYALTYMAAVLKLPYLTVYLVLTFALLLGAPFFIFWGWLSDKIGRRPIMVGGFMLAAITFFPCFDLLKQWSDNPVLLCIVVWYMVILVTMVYGPIAAFLVEFFPARIRYTSMSLPYHIGNGVFGGGVPFLVTLFATAANPLMGLYYPIGIAALGVAVNVFAIKPTHQVRIWDEVGGQPAE
jgi:MFS family permease